MAPASLPPSPSPTPASTPEQEPTTLTSTSTSTSASISNSTSNPQPETITNPIIHIVHFRFYKHIPTSVRSSISRQFVALQTRCLHPVTRKPYIKSFTGGKDVSIENLHKGFHAAFVLEFESPEDRDWYVNSDPVHRGFGVDCLTGVVEDVMVVDFRRGEF
ncbi:hypothetical protein G647_03839 [Cladophialophora carrionii CBS 160.54]|uniref:Stress-response A/B barrel domain-containing protein n=1 Tax=Cladophialophora carrionii CBS 160.54 TaxID=1279043 RepID=V9DCA6_9EURO|nr:uncharacterized protein G647_03839 [Cladophialophora carrionii CBS 160.54]ETI24470.1 hypothetical protein G647_03839 [Cladophialophora carrionii CBS 160.54]